MKYVENTEEIMKGKIDGLILDVDGTLWDSTGLVAKAWTQAVRQGGIEGYSVEGEQLKQLFGKTMEVIAQEMFPDASQEMRDKLMELCCEYEHRVLCEDECAICYPGVIEGIRRLSKKVPVFIVSNCQSGYIELFLEKTGLSPYVTDTECYGNTGRGKGENISLVIQRNQLKNPVYVGDTQGDCDASDEAGVPFIFASYGFGDPDHMAERITRFEELDALIEEGIG